MNNLFLKFAQAAGDNIKLPNVVDSSNPQNVDLNTIVNFLMLIIGIAFKVAGVIALIFALYAGVQYVLSFGDDSKAETAKKTFYWAVIGLIVVALATWIVGFVGTEFISPPPAGS